jgi:type I restriction enzyme R subunit
MNQNPEQIARDAIDYALQLSGWIVQGVKEINLNAGSGVAVREYQTDVGPADYVLFIDGKPCGIIEAKREDEGHRINIHETQGEDYAKAKLKHLNNEPLPFVFISTGEITRFTDFTDPKPRARELFCFHRPETMRDWLKKDKSLRKRLNDLPALQTGGLRECQIKAINQLEISFKENRPRALIQMATGSGKTFTAITFIYRLLKFAKAKRVLFLVDTKNLGEQAEQEFMSYLPNDDNRKFTELYSVQRLKSSYIATDSQVCISTIQRLYSILKGTELEESEEEVNPNESRWFSGWQPKEIPPIEYDPKMPIEFFDFIVIDECHRSIYNLWKQVLEYYDAFEIGLTATPDKRTIAYFDQNLVSEYSHEMAVADGVNVAYEIFIIDTKVTQQGSTLWKGEYFEHRERLSRKKRLELQDEDEEYSKQQLDKDVVNPNQIRTIIRTFKENLPKIFPDRFTVETGQTLFPIENKIFEVPKTLIFAKTDSHANDIIDIVREEFAEENRFCKKITYKTDEDPKSVLSQFRNDYYPRIAVTVDMIATGTDVKPLEVLLFMRDVKSKNYFEQMKGRGTRTIELDSLRKVTPSAKYTKDHFVIVDAIGVTKSVKTDSRPLEKKPGVPLKDLLQAVAVGAREEELFTTLAGRLSRLDRQITQKERSQFMELANGKTIPQVVKELLDAFNPDILEEIETNVRTVKAGFAPVDIDKAINIETVKLQNEAARIFTGKLNEYIENVRKAHEQRIDISNPDEVIKVGWDKDDKVKAGEMVKDFTTWMEENKNELLALQIFYNQPFRRRELTYTMIREVLEKLQNEKPRLAPINVWRAYEALEQCNGSPRNELTAIVSLIRKISGLDTTLTTYDKTVDKNFQDWVWKKHSGAGEKFSEEQMEWLRMIKEYVVNSFHIEKEDFDLNPFNAQGGLGRMWQLFGAKTEEIISELNEVLAA